jgi:antitoxin (DNA-binding transcriptional repressor) of toxin-antitoxin stability system
MSIPMFASEAPTGNTGGRSAIVTSSVEVISIYEAKTQFSKLVKRAKSGETIYIGAYGRPEAILAPVPARPEIRFGVLAHLRDPGFDDSIEAWEADEESTALFEASANEDWEY